MFGKYVFGGENGELNGFIRFGDIKRISRFLSAL